MVSTRRHSSRAKSMPSWWQDRRNAPSKRRRTDAVVRRPGLGFNQPVRMATACRICAVGCGTLVDVEDGRVVRVTGDPDDPWSYGFTCSKGRAGPDFHHAPDRLDVPAIRRDGVLTPVSWAEALDDIAAITRGIVDEHGP